MDLRVEFSKDHREDFENLISLADDVNLAIGNTALALILTDNNIKLVCNCNVTTFVYSDSGMYALKLDLDMTLQAMRAKWKPIFQKLSCAISHIESVPYYEYKDACVVIDYDGRQRFAYSEAGFNAFANLVAKISVDEARTVRRS